MLCYGVGLCSVCSVCRSARMLLLGECKLSAVTHVCVRVFVW